MDTTARLALPLIAPGQAQKEMTHNEALAMLDMLVQGSVLTLGLDTPPADPAPGDCWIVGETPTGAWAGKAGAIAGWAESGWRFAAPREGAAFWVSDGGGIARWIAGEWVRAMPLPAIGEPGGGSVVDAEARAAIAAVLAALIEHRLVVAS